MGKNKPRQVENDCRVQFALSDSRWQQWAVALERQWSAVKSSQERAGWARASSRTPGRGSSMLVSDLDRCLNKSQWLVESPQCEPQKNSWRGATPSKKKKIRFQCFESRPEDRLISFLRAELVKLLIYSLNISLNMQKKKKEVRISLQCPSSFPSDWEPHHSVEEYFRHKTTWQPWSPWTRFVMRPPRSL